MIHAKQIDNFWQGLGYFAVGAGQGAASCFGPWAAIGAGTAAGGLNAALDGGGMKEVGLGMLVGGASSAVGSLAGAGVGLGMNAMGLDLSKITNPILSGAIRGGIGGAGAGYASGFTGGLIASGGDFDAANKAGLQGMLVGGGMGIAAGIGTSMAKAYNEGRNPFTGEKYRSNKIGNIGMEKAGLEQNTKRLEYNKKGTIPDGYDEIDKTISEVKNADKIDSRSVQQIKLQIDVSQNMPGGAYEYQLFIRTDRFFLGIRWFQGTQIPSAIQPQIDNGTINIQPLKW